MEIIILGSGSSIGVPAIGCKCDTCLSTDPKNRRSRASIMMRWDNFHLLIDTSPDLWSQAIKNKLERVDAVIFTHEHADHIAGIDNLRSFNFLKDGPLDVYALAHTLDYLESNYAYCFAEMKSSTWYKPHLIAHRRNHGDVLKLGGKEVSLFTLDHGNIDVLGIRVDKIAYTTDFKSVPTQSESFLENLDLWVIDCLKYEESPGHLSFAQSLELIEKYKPKRAVLCHLAHELEYNEIKGKVPANVQVGFDGLVVNV